MSDAEKDGGSACAVGDLWARRISAYDLKQRSVAARTVRFPDQRVKILDRICRELRSIVAPVLQTNTDLIFQVSNQKPPRLWVHPKIYATINIGTIDILIIERTAHDDVVLLKTTEIERAIDWIVHYTSNYIDFTQGDIR